MVNLNRNNSNWSFEERRKINENWAILESMANSTASGNNGLKQEVDQLKVTVGQNTTRSTNALQTANQAKSESSSLLAAVNESDRKSEQATVIANEAKTTAEGIDGKVNEANETADNALQVANESNLKSDGANLVANDAKDTAEMIQNQFNQVVAEAGSNNPEVVLSRNDSETGETFVNLPQRLDSQYKQINERLLREEKRTRTLPLSISFFDIVGDGIVNETNKLQAAIDYCYENNLTLDLGSFTIRTDSIILKCNMDGNNATVLFNEGHNFKNYESDGSVRYRISYLGKGITFESDKSRYWNPSDAGDSYVSNVVRPDVIRKYGQRVYIGNKTTTPNNILSNVPEEQINGTGFWNKFYSQWMSEEGINLNDLSTTFDSITNKADTNTLSSVLGNGVISSSFVGFSVGLTIRGAYELDLNSATFKRCKVGLFTTDAGALPGRLADTGAKCTTTNIRKCLFEDISVIGHYAFSYLQGYITDNIYQPCKVGVGLFYGADNIIEKNYNEICCIGLYIGTNSATNNVIDNNFNNTSYVNYSFYCRYGSRNKFSNNKGNRRANVAAAASNCDFDNSYTLIKDNDYFYQNGNSIERQKTKYCIFSVTGVNGTSFTTNLIESNRDAIISTTGSNSGIYFNGREEILSIEHVSNGTHFFLGYYEIPGGSTKTIFLDRLNFDTSPARFQRGDFRTDGQTVVLRVAFNEGYTN